MNERAIPDNLDLTVFFESEPFHESRDEGIVSYAVTSPSGRRLEVSFDRVFGAIFVKIFDNEQLLADFGTEGVQHVVLHDNAERVLECHLRASGFSGSVRIEIGSDMKLTTSLMNEDTNRQ